MLIENVEIHVRSITEIYQTKEEIQKKNEKQMKDSFDSKSDQNRELDTVIDLDLLSTTLAASTCQR